MLFVGLPAMSTYCWMCGSDSQYYPTRACTISWCCHLLSFVALEIFSILTRDWRFWAGIRDCVIISFAQNNFILITNYRHFSAFRITQIFVDRWQKTKIFGSQIIKFQASCNAYMYILKKMKVGLYFTLAFILTIKINIQKVQQCAWQNYVKQGCKLHSDCKFPLNIQSLFQVTIWVSVVDEFMCEVKNWSCVHSYIPYSYHLNESVMRGRCFVPSVGHGSKF